MNLENDPSDFHLKITLMADWTKMLRIGAIPSVCPHLTCYNSQVCCCMAPTRCSPQCSPQCSSQPTLWRHGRPPRTQPRMCLCSWWGQPFLGLMGYLWARMFVYSQKRCCCYEAKVHGLVFRPSLSPTVVASVGSDGSPTPAELQQRTRKL